MNRFYEILKFNCKEKQCRICSNKRPKKELNRIKIAVDKWNIIPNIMKKYAVWIPVKIRIGNTHSNIITHQQINFDNMGLLIKIWANLLFPKLSVFIIPTIAAPSLHTGETNLARPDIKYERRDWKHKKNMENFWIMGSEEAA